jgi:hypothetical protein
MLRCRRADTKRSTYLPRLPFLPFHGEPSDSRTTVVNLGVLRSFRLARASQMITLGGESESRWRGRRRYNMSALFRRCDGTMVEMGVMVNGKAAGGESGDAPEADHACRGRITKAPHTAYKWAEPMMTEPGYARRDSLRASGSLRSGRRSPTPRSGHCTVCRPRR